MDSELVTVDIHINTNATEEERKHLYVPEEAIISFVGEGFQNNLYQGRVLHECMPRAVYPDVMTVIINIKDIAEGLIAIGTIIHALIKFFKKTGGFYYGIFQLSSRRTSDTRYRTWCRSRNLGCCKPHGGIWQ